MVNGHVVLLHCFVFLWLRLSHAADTLAAGSVMKDWEFLVSPNNVFKFGFFNPIFSGNRYLGIQYMNYSELKIVWVANRENPLTDSSGYLNITDDGNLIIHDQRGTSITVNSEKPATSSNISVTLLNSGNLVLKEGQQVVWQSFDHPTDTMLPGMKIGLFGLKLNRPRIVSLTSWIGLGVPAVGAFTLGVDPNNTKQLMIWRRGVPYWRSGNWNGKNFTYFSLPDPESRKSLKFSHISNEDESYFTYTLTDYNFSWMEMNSTGIIPIFLGQLDGGWYYEHGQNCDVENGYTPEGCIKQQPSKCRSGDKFLLTLGTMEDWTYSNNISLGLNDCREICRNDCTCKAYGSGSADGSGCKFSHGKRFEDPPIDWTESFYIRNSTSQNDTTVSPKQDRSSTLPVAPPRSLPINKGKA